MIEGYWYLRHSRMYLVVFSKVTADASIIDTAPLLVPKITLRIKGDMGARDQQPHIYRSSPNDSYR